MINIKESVIIILSTILSISLMTFFQIIGNANMMYASVSASLIGVLAFSIKKIKCGSCKNWYFFIGALLWYSLFWTIRDSIRGFYTPTERIEEFLSLAPLVMIMTQFVFNKKEPWIYCIAIIVHSFLVMIMCDTDNELIAVLAIIMLTNTTDKNVKYILYGLVWYQAFIASSKYLIHIYTNRDLIYYISLLPYLLFILVVFSRKVLEK